MKKVDVKNIGLSAMFIAIGLVLPFFTGQVPKFGNLLLPMHLPVFFCGLICGWKYGAAVGLIIPLMRSVIFGMPIMIPTAAAMAVELLTYGLVVGFLYSLSKKKSLFMLYFSLIIAMMCGRVTWAIAQLIILGLTGSSFTMQMFMAGAFLNAIPGIVLQLVLIPIVMVRLKKTKVKGKKSE